MHAAPQATSNPVSAPASLHTASRKANCFDFLRLFAALAVVIGHSTHHFGVAFLWVQPDSRWWFRDGVTLFFIISGHLIYRSAERCLQDGRPVYQFYLNRLLRVAPAIWFYLILTTLAVFAFGILSMSQIGTIQFAGWFWSTVFLVPVYHPAIWHGIGSGEVNGSLWTIPVECSFYAIVPFLAWFARKRSFNTMLAMTTTVALVGLIVAWRLDIPRSETMIGKLYNITFFPYLWYFTMGIFWYRFWPRAPKSKVVFGAAFVIYALARLTMQGFNETGGFSAYLGSVVWGIPFSYVVVWIGYRGPLLLSRLTERVGDLSFGVYIWHMVVINAVLIYGSDLISSPVANPLVHLFVVAMSLVVATLSWRLIEKPALKLKPFTSRESPSKAHATPARSPVRMGEW